LRPQAHPDFAVPFPKKRRGGEHLPNVSRKTSNIVESPFALVRLRTNASRQYKHVEGAKEIIWKMLRVAEQSWRKRNAPELLPLVAVGVTFKNGVRTSPGRAERNTTQQPERTADWDPFTHLLAVTPFRAKDLSM
jgi:hypothetical protein